MCLIAMVLRNQVYFLELKTRKLPNWISFQMTKAFLRYDQGYDIHFSQQWRLNELKWVWQKQPAAHPNPWASLLPGHRARLCFPASFVCKYGHVTELCTRKGKQKSYVLPPRSGPWKLTTSSQCTIPFKPMGNSSPQSILENIWRWQNPI